MIVRHLLAQYRQAAVTQRQLHITAKRGGATRTARKSAQAADRKDEIADALAAVLKAAHRHREIES